jgi:hypothetical protein
VAVEHDVRALLQGVVLLQSGGDLQRRVGPLGVEEHHAAAVEDEAAQVDDVAEVRVLELLRQEMSMLVSGRSVGAIRLR